MEIIKPEYYDQDFLKTPAYTLYRQDINGKRHYCRKDGSNLRPSVTTILDEIALKSESYALEKFKEKYPFAGSKIIADQAAKYGTFLHMQINEMYTKGYYDFDNIIPVICDYLRSDDYHEYERRIKNDMSAYIAFHEEKEVMPIACEIPLHNEYFAGCIDLVCTLRHNKKRELAIIDFKSRQTGQFYRHEEYQLILYRDLWNYNFPDLPIKYIFNWSPKDWTKKPTYALKNQTKACDGKMQSLFVLLGEYIASNRELVRNETHKSISEYMVCNFQINKLETATFLKEITGLYSLTGEHNNYIAEYKNIFEIMKAEK